MFTITNDQRFMPWHYSEGNFFLFSVTRANRIRLRDYYSCREDFYRVWQGNNPILFCSKKPYIIAFFDLIETALKLKQRTQFQKTSVQWLWHVTPSSFWTHYKKRNRNATARLRQSLFTGMLRAGSHYWPEMGTDLKCLVKVIPYDLVRQTANALLKFFSGHVVFRGRIPYTGWHFAMLPPDNWDADTNEQYDAAVDRGMDEHEAFVKFNPVSKLTKR